MVMAKAQDGWAKNPLPLRDYAWSGHFYSHSVSQSKSLGQPNISRTRKCILSLVGGTSKSHGKRIGYREWWRIQNNAIFHSFFFNNSQFAIPLVSPPPVSCPSQPVLWTWSDLRIGEKLEGHQLSLHPHTVGSPNTIYSLRVHPVLCAHIQRQWTHYIMRQPALLWISQTQQLNPSRFKLKLASSSDASYVPWSHRG